MPPIDPQQDPLYKAFRTAEDLELRQQYGVDEEVVAPPERATFDTPTPDEEALESSLGAAGRAAATTLHEGGQAVAESLTAANPDPATKATDQKVITTIADLITGGASPDEVAEMPGLTAIGPALAAVPFLGGTIRSSKKIAQGLSDQAQRLFTEGKLATSQNEMVAELTDKLMKAGMGTVSNEQAIAKAKELQKAGGVTAEQLLEMNAIDPTTPVAEQVMIMDTYNREVVKFKEMVELALLKKDPQLQAEAFAQLRLLNNFGAAVAERNAAIARTQQVNQAFTAPIDKFQLGVSRLQEIGKDATPDDILRTLNAAFQEPKQVLKYTSQEFRDLYKQLQKTDNPAEAQEVLRTALRVARLTDEERATLNSQLAKVKSAKDAVDEAIKVLAQNVPESAIPPSLERALKGLETVLTTDPVTFSSRFAKADHELQVEVMTIAKRIHEGSKKGDLEAVQKGLNRLRFIERREGRLFQSQPATSQPVKKVTEEQMASLPPSGHPPIAHRYLNVKEIAQFGKLVPTVLDRDHKSAAVLYSHEDPQYARRLEVLFNAIQHAARQGDNKAVAEGFLKYTRMEARWLKANDLGAIVSKTGEVDPKVRDLAQIFDELGFTPDQVAEHITKAGPPDQRVLDFLYKQPAHITARLQEFGRDAIPLLTQHPANAVRQLLGNDFDPKQGQKFLNLAQDIQKSFLRGDMDQTASLFRKYERAKTRLEQATKKQQLSQITLMEQEQLGKAFRNLAGKDLTPQEMLQAIMADKDANPAQIADTLARIRGKSNIAQWYVVNQLLTPSSNAINITATMALVPMELAARYGASKVTQVARLLGHDVSEMIQPGEATTYLQGYMGAFTEALRAGAKTFRTGELSIGPSVQDLPPISPLSKIARNKEGALATGIEWLGTALELNGRTMLSADQAMKVMAYRGEIASKAFRAVAQDAAEKGLKPHEIKKLYREKHEELVLNASQEVLDEATQHALYMTFNNDPKGILQSAQQLRNKHPLFATAVMPFFRTIANAGYRTFEYTPGSALQLLSKEFREGLQSSDMATKQMYYARMFVGSGIMSLGAMLHQTGLLTADTKEEEAKASLARDVDYSNDSLRVGDRWVNAYLLGPLGASLILGGRVSRLIELYGDDEASVNDIAAHGVTTMAGVFQLGMLKDTGNILTMLSDAGGNKEMAQMAATLGRRTDALTPSTLRFLKRDVFQQVPLLREGFDVVERFESEVKWFNGDLPLKRDLYGNPREPLGRFLAGKGKYWDDPFINTLVKYKVVPPETPKTYKDEPLTHEQWDARQKARGEAMIRLAEQPSAWSWVDESDFSDEGKADVLHKLLEKANKEGDARWLRDQEDLIERVVSRKMKKIGVSPQLHME